MSSESGSSFSLHALAAGTQIRDYTIVSVIGTGGFSIVYKALDNALMREVAIKEYFPASFALRAADGTVQPHSRDSATYGKGIESFLNEGKLLAAFDHPALVRVYRCWEERGTAYLAMRLYSGTTLRDAVSRGDWNTDEVSLRALLQPLCDALDLLHASKCYHRDVAPDNIMLVDGGAPVLLDFGAARKTIEGTQVFTAILKPGYAPIEQYGDGELKQGPWTDIYALAGVVHFTLAGSAPPTAISRMLRDAMPRPREAFVGRLPERWLDAIEHALAVKPEMRPQTISEFIALFGWDTATGSTDTPASAPVPATALPPFPTPLSSLRDDVAPVADTAQTRLVAEQTVVVPQPQVIADERTVVVPQPMTAQATAAASPPSTPSTPTARPAREAERPVAPPAKPRPVVWFAAVAGVLAVAVAAVAWKLGSSPATSAAAPIPSANDVLLEKKPSIPITGGLLDSAQPATPAAPIVKPDTPQVQQSAPVVTAATPKPKPPRTKAVDEGGEAASTRSRKRPERCNVLIERFQLGEAMSDADQRFIRESCK